MLSRLSFPDSGFDSARRRFAPRNASLYGCDLAPSSVTWARFRPQPVTHQPCGLLLRTKHDRRCGDAVRRAVSRLKCWVPGFSEGHAACVETPLSVAPGPYPEVCRRADETRCIVRSCVNKKKAGSRDVAEVTKPLHGDLFAPCGLRFTSHSSTYRRLRPSFQERSARRRQAHPVARIRAVTAVAWLLIRRFWSREFLGPPCCGS